MRFWDSSAPVPLVVAQPHSASVEEWLAEDSEIVLWTVTPAEIVSALRRLVRDGALAERDAVASEAIAAEVYDASHVVRDGDAVRDGACRLLRVHALRAADALQLAAALAWAGQSAAGLVVHTFDRRLALAAQREGFSVVPAPPG